MRKKKAAPLTGSLLTQDKTDRSTGFVISLVDRLKEAQTAADEAPEQPKRKDKSPRAKRSAGADPSVDIADSIRPKHSRSRANTGRGTDGPGPAKAVRTPPRDKRPSAADLRPSTTLSHTVFENKKGSCSTMPNASRTSWRRMEFR